MGIGYDIKMHLLGFINNNNKVKIKEKDLKIIQDAPDIDVILKYDFDLFDDGSINIDNVEIMTDEKLGKGF